MSADQNEILSSYRASFARPNSGEARRMRSALEQGLQDAAHEHMQLYVQYLHDITTPPNELQVGIDSTRSAAIGTFEYMAHFAETLTNMLVTCMDSEDDFLYPGFFDARGAYSQSVGLACSVIDSARKGADADMVMFGALSSPSLSRFGTTEKADAYMITTGQIQQALPVWEHDPSGHQLIQRAASLTRHSVPNGYIPEYTKVGTEFAVWLYRQVYPIVNAGYIASQEVE